VKQREFIVALLLLSSLVACAKSDKPEVVPDKQKPTSRDVGPFQLKLSGEAKTVTNQFSIDIDQSEGGVDFNLTAASNTRYLVFESHQTQVTGCRADTVEVYPIWIANTSTGGKTVVQKSDLLLTEPGRPATMRVAFRGLDGCKHLEFKMIVRNLEIGTIQPRVPSELQGEWSHRTSAGRDYSLYITPDQTDWREYEGSQNVCLESFNPSYAIAKSGGWLVFRSGQLVCRYARSAGAPDQMKLTCHGQNINGCTSPKNAVFTRN